jgi:predicted dehydrogenase
LGVGRTHIQSYQAAGVDVVGLADVVETGLKKAQDQYGIATGYTDYRDFLARDDVDMVSICTPDRLHAEQVLAALDAGKHVLCEKPMVITTGDAASIVKKVRETGLKFVMCYNYRFVLQSSRRAGAVGADRA